MRKNWSLKSGIITIQKTSTTFKKIKRPININDADTKKNSII